MLVSIRCCHFNISAAKWVLLQVYHSMMQAARGVVQQHGFRGLYRGLNITLLEIIPYAALQFGLYDTFTAAWSKAHRRRLSAKVISAMHLYNLVCAAVKHMCVPRNT